MESFANSSAYRFNHIFVRILEYLDEKSLENAGNVCQSWRDIISTEKSWRKVILRQTDTDIRWRRLGKRRGWYLKLTEGDEDIDDYRKLFYDIDKDLSNLEYNWRNCTPLTNYVTCGTNLHSVYTVQLDDDKMVVGLRDNSIQIWNRNTLECERVLKGHDGSVMCLQYDSRHIISGSSDSTIRVWDIGTGEEVHMMEAHSSNVLCLKYHGDVMVTGSKDNTAAIWDISDRLAIRHVASLVGHIAPVNVIDFDENHIITGSGDRKLKVWQTRDGRHLHDLIGHKRGVSSLHYQSHRAVSGSNDNTIRIWNTETAECLRILEGHESMVRSITFDSSRIVSGDYDGKVKVWDLSAAMNANTCTDALCIHTLETNGARVYKIKLMVDQVVASMSDGTIALWDFLIGNTTPTVVQDG